MSQYEVPGGATIDSGDRRINKKVVVALNGATPQPPGAEGRLTNISITKEGAGISRGVYEYTQGGFGDASYNIYGKKIEIIGGTREIPIYNHPVFAALSNEQIASVQKAAEEKQKRSFTDEGQQRLFTFLSRGTEYFLAPQVVGRVSEIESFVPDLTLLCKVVDPPEITAPEGTFWVLTGISCTPIGEKYEVTREYTSIPAAWEDVSFLYNNWSSSASV